MVFSILDTVVDRVINLKTSKGFPKLTICLNSQHSADKINLLFNATKDEILRAMPFLYGSYGDDHGEKFFQFLHRKRDILDQMDMDRFINDTKSEITVIACKYLSIDCRKDWKEVNSMFGL